MDLANIEDVERFQPFLDAINKEQKMIFLEKETKKIYWKYIKPRNMRVTPICNEIKLEINLIIDINTTPIRYIFQLICLLMLL